MDPETYRARYRQINLQMTRHRYWDACLRTPYGHPWIKSVVERLIVLADGAPVDYLETIGDVDGERAVALRAFTATRLLTVRGVYREGPGGGPEAEVSAKARTGLVRLDVLDLAEYGAETWPYGLTLRLAYADGEEFTLGVSGVTGAEDEASARLAAFYPSLIGDLDRVAR